MLQISTTSKQIGFKGFPSFSVALQPTKMKADHFPLKPMDFLWISYGFPMDFLWISYGFPWLFVCSSAALQVDLDAFQDSAGEVLDRLLWGSSGYLQKPRYGWKTEIYRINDDEFTEKLFFFFSQINVCSIIYIYRVHLLILASWALLFSRPSGCFLFQRLKARYCWRRHRWKVELARDPSAFDSSVFSKVDTHLPTGKTFPNGYWSSVTRRWTILYLILMAQFTNDQDDLMMSIASDRMRPLPRVRERRL